MDMTETPLHSTSLYKGRIVSLRVDEVRLPNGVSARREVVDHPGGICIAPLTEAGDLLFVRQFRYPYGGVLLELPAGKLTPGEDPLAAGKRELLEKTGAVAERYHSLGLVYPSPGYCGEIIHLFAARVSSRHAPQPDEDEFLDCVAIPLESAAQMVMNGEIYDAKTQIAILELRSLCAEGGFKSEELRYSENNPLRGIVCIFRISML